MLPPIYTDSIYTLIFILTYGIWALSELLGPVRWGGEREGKKHDQGSLAVGFLCGPLGTIFSLLAPLFLHGNMPEPVSFWVGIVVVGGGLGFRWYSIAVLGKYFTAVIMIQEKQPLIQDGPYRWMRHPSYFGVFVAMGGIGIMIGNWFSMFLLLITFYILLLYRIEKEEQVLLQTLGEEYEQYRKNTTSFPFWV